MTAQCLEPTLERIEELPPPPAVVHVDPELCRADDCVDPMELLQDRMTKDFARKNIAAKRAKQHFETLPYRRSDGVIYWKEGTMRK